MNFEKIELGQCFHAFGQDFEPQVPAHRNDGRGDLHAGQVIRDVAYKTLVDFQLVNREAFEIGQ